MGRLNQRERAKQFRDNLRALVRNRGWTQAEAAKRMQLQYVVVRKYLNEGLANVTPLNRPRLEKICRTLGIEKVEYLWAPNLKPFKRDNIWIDSDAESFLFQLRFLLQEDFRELPDVKKLCKKIEAAFDKFVCGMSEPAERSRGRSFIDMDSSKKVVRQNRRLRDGRNRKEDD